MKTVKINILPWHDDPVCAKCCRKKSDNGLEYRLMFSYPDILFMNCNRCGYEWFMSTEPEEDD